MSFLGHFWRISQRNQFTLSLARLSFGPSHFLLNCLNLFLIGLNMSFERRPRNSLVENKAKRNGHRTHVWGQLSKTCRAEFSLTAFPSLGEIMKCAVVFKNEERSLDFLLLFHQGKSHSKDILHLTSWHAVRLGGLCPIKEKWLKKPFPSAVLNKWVRLHLLN